MLPIKHSSIAVLACGLVWNTLPAAAQQQITVTAPMQGVSDGFFESVGVGFGARGPNWFFNNGGGGALPQFGGFDPNGGANFGFGFAFPGGSGFVNVGASQGSSRGMSSVSPSVTMLNGTQATISDVFQRPFVTGVVPVVGGFSSMAAPQYSMFAPSAERGPSMLQERLSRIQESGGFKPFAGANEANSGAAAASAKIARVRNEDLAADHLSAARQSTAGRPAASLAEIRRRQADEVAATAREAQDLLDRGQQAYAVGKLGVARIYYQQAAGKAQGALKDEALAKLKSLGDSRGSR